jgi:hypothetical protein
VFRGVPPQDRQATGRLLLILWGTGRCRAHALCVRGVGQGEAGPDADHALAHDGNNCRYTAAVRRGLGRRRLLREACSHGKEEA